MNFQKGQRLYNLLDNRGSQENISIRLVDSDKKVQDWKCWDARNLSSKGFFTLKYS